MSFIRCWFVEELCLATATNFVSRGRKIRMVLDLARAAQLGFGLGVSDLGNCTAGKSGAVKSSRKE